jgi:type II secretory pathway component PulF
MTKLITMSNFSYRLAKFTFGAKDRLSIYQKLASFLTNGVDIDSSMEQMIAGYRHFNKNDVRAKIINEWRESIATGMTFSNALSMWAPPGEVMLIKAGEKSGDLAEAMNNACLATDAGKKMKSAIVSKMSYPAVLMVILCVMLYVFAVQAIPQLAETKNPDTWPSISKGLYNVSYVINNFWAYIIIFLVSSTLLVSTTMSKWTSKFRSRIEFLPPYSIYKSYQGSIFLVSLSAMMKTGTPIWDALDELKDLSSPYMRKHIGVMQGRLLNGVSVGSALETGLLDQDIAIDLRVYASTSNIEGKMGVIGQSAIEAGVKRISTIGSALNGLAIVLIGGYIGWTILGFSLLTRAIASDATM